MEEYGDMLIGTFLPSREYYSARTNQTVVVSISLLLIFIALLFVIMRTVDNQIISGIGNINNSIRSIAQSGE
ncbi:MAG: hypothetical protein J6P60_03670 [Lachnospiraceae bacterium]|nr:hypothetical protein [Lachnospiraceae bacterium]